MTALEFHPPYPPDAQAEIIAVADGGRVVVVRSVGRRAGVGFDVWVGDQDDRQLMGTTATEAMALAYAGGFA